MPEISTAPIGQLFLDDLVHSSPFAIYTCDENGYITWFNQAAVELWGRAPEIGKDLWCGSWKIYYPDGRPMGLDECPMALTLKSGKPHERIEIKIQQPDHQFKDLLVFPRPIFNNGKLTGAINTLIDITGQKQSEQKQYILSAIVESSDDAIISKNLNGVITSWNNGARRIFGYTEDEVIGKHITILIPQHLRTEEDVIIRNIKAGKKIDHFRTIRMTKDGREIHLSLTVSPVKDAFGNIIGASKIARDIHEQLQRENDLKLANQRLEILNSISKYFMGKIDQESILQKITDTTTELTGAAFGAFFYNLTNEKGESLMLYTLSGAPKEAFEKFGMPRNTDIFHPTFSGQAVVRVNDITKDPRYGKNPPYHGMPKGHLPVVSYMAVPVITPGGGVLGGLFFGHPDPGVFKAEHENMVVSIAAQASVALDNARLFQEVKALSIKKDEFIALAGHEMKTPLTILKGYLQLLDKEEKDPLKKMFLDKSVHQADKLNALIEELLDITRIESGKLPLLYEHFDFKKMILDIIETLHYTNKTHEIIASIPEKNFYADADMQRMEQVMTNLLGNAIKYSPKAKKIYLDMDIQDDLLLVKVKDEGIGISKEDQNKIFTRFFRIAEDKGISGLGLGLYLSKEIIDRHGGTISVNSEKGKGAEFCFSIPIKKKK